MKINLSRLSLFVLLGAAVVALGLAWASPASAGAPVITPVPNPGDIALDGYCTFPALLHFNALKEYDKFYSSNGSLVDIVTGVDKVQLTNLETGKSIAVNISSAGETHFNADGSGTMNITGPTLFYLTEPPPGLPALFAFSGLWHIQWDPAQNSTFSYKGRITDLCQALQ